MSVVAPAKLSSTVLEQVGIPSKLLRLLSCHFLKKHNKLAFYVDKCRHLATFLWFISCQWKRTNCKQSARWQHLSRLKASASLFENFLLGVKKQQLILEFGNAI
jgi:hypothetical protein